MRIALILITLLFYQQALSGQACCSGGTPLSSNLGIQSVAEKTIQLQLIYDYNTQQTLIETSNNLLAENNRARNTHSVLLRGTYAFNSRWSTSILLSWVQQEEEIIRPGREDYLAIATGIGDVVGFVQYTFETRPEVQLVAAGGAKIPVGAVDRLDPETGIPLNPDLQPGTGAWDGIFGLNYLRTGLWRPTMGFSISATYRLTFPDQRFGGLQKYEFGDEFQVLFGLSDQIWAPYLSPSLFLRYRHTQKDKTFDAATPNTGGHWLHLVPGMEININPQFSFNLSGEIPLYRYLTGTQLTTTYRLKLGINYAFQP